MIGTLFNLFRIIVLPISIVLVSLSSSTTLTWALILLLLSYASNFIEDLLKARKELVKSFFDPFADKIVVAGLLLFYTIWGSFWWWVLTLFVVRDLLVGILRWNATRDDVLIEEGLWPKTLATLQFGIVFCLILQELFIFEFLISNLVLVFTGISIVIALVSLIFYAVYYKKVLRERKALGKLSTPGKMLVLVNRLSGGYQSRYRRHLLKIFSRRRQAPIVFLEKKGNFFTTLRQKIKTAEKIVIAGGDGSFESALNSPLLYNKPLGFFPLGKGNAFYSYFYKGKRFEYLRSRFGFHEIDLDVLEIEWEKGKKQTEFLSLGIDADVIRFSQDRKHTGFFAYFKAGTKAVFKSQGSYDLELKVDGKKIYWENCFNLTLGKIPYYGFGMRSLFHVLPDDGKVYGLGYVNKHSPLFNKALRLWTIFMVNMGMNKAPVVEIKGKVIEVRSEAPFPVQAGGEFLGFMQYLKIRVVRKQKVLVI